MSKNIVIRCDANPQIGLGHIMRCLTLATELIKQGYNLHFIMIEPDGSIQQLIKNHNAMCWSVYHEDEGLNVIGALSPACVVVDHYDLGVTYHRQISPLAEKVMVIDDLADREFDCDILLNQNFQGNALEQYKKLISPDTKLLLGPEFALLRQEFTQVRKQVTVRKNPIQSILLFFGGGDHLNITQQVLEAFQQAKIAADIHVIVGSLNQHKESIRKLCDLNSWQYHENVQNISAHMLTADLALGAGGTAVLERASLGLPSIITTVADNQIEPTKEAAKAGIIKYIGPAEHLQNTDWLQAIAEMREGNALETMSSQAMKLIDGLGAQKVAQEIVKTMPKKLNTYLRPMCKEDLEMVRAWRNADHVRIFMHNQEPIPLENHKQWFAKVLAAPAKYDYQVFIYNNKPVGLMGFFDFSADKKQCEWGFYLGEKNLPKGVGSIMGRLAVKHVFENHSTIDNLYGEALKSNPRSIALHKKLGFTALANYDEATEGTIPFMLKRNVWKKQ